MGGQGESVTELLGGVRHALPLDQRVEATELVMRVRPRAKHRVAARLDEVVGLRKRRIFVLNAADFVSMCEEKPSLITNMATILFLVYN